MANRSIRTEIWNDEFIEEKRPLDRLLYVYLLTNDRTHICGFYKITPSTISAQTGMTKRQIEESMAHLEPKIIFTNGWICIKNYRSYQAGGGEKIEIAIENELKKVPREILDRVSKIWDRVSDFSDTPIVNTNMNVNTNRGSVRGEKFTPPSVEEVRAYCLERRNGVDAQQFVDFYTSKGWKIGKESMKDWMASVRTWEKRQGNSPSPPKKCKECGKDAGVNWVQVSGGIVCNSCFGTSGQRSAGKKKLEEMKAGVLKSF